MCGRQQQGPVGFRVPHGECDDGCHGDLDGRPAWLVTFGDVGSSAVDRHVPRSGDRLPMTGSGNAFIQLLKLNDSSQSILDDGGRLQSKTDGRAGSSTMAKPSVVSSGHRTAAGNTIMRS
jgi:hypothetical protein